MEAAEESVSLSGGDADCGSVVSEGVGVEVVCTVSGSCADSLDSSSAAYIYIE